MRELTQSTWYRSRWPLSGLDSSQRILEFRNKSGGWRLSTTPGSDATGYHANAHVVDDPIKPRDAGETRGKTMKAKLEEVYDWWTKTMSTRAKNAETLRRVIIMQRVHDQDLSGRMLEEGGYEHLILPMEFNPKVICSTTLGRPDPRTEEGELLDPQRYPREAVDRLRIELGSAASAQLDQTPIALEGGLFQLHYFSHRWQPRAHASTPKTEYNLLNRATIGEQELPSNATVALPRSLFLVQSWDLRFKNDAERGSYVVGQQWGYQPGHEHIYLLDQVRGRFSYAETKDAFKELNGRWPKTRVQLIENKANGPALASDLENEGYNIELVDPLGDKVLRANVAEPLWRAGFVVIPEEAEWVDEFITEHIRFPRYKTDDQVDAASQALSWIKTKNSIDVYVAGVRGAMKRG